MTRFARAKGSKASNLKMPDDSTPWDVMKEQMLQAKKESEESKNRQIAENQRIENYSKFLKEQKVQKRKSTWCDFPESENNKKVKLQQTEDNKLLKKKNKVKKVIETNHNFGPNHKGNDQKTLNNDTGDISSKKKKKSKPGFAKHEANLNIRESETNCNLESSEKETFSETLKHDVGDISNTKKKKKKKSKTGTAIPESNQNIKQTDIMEEEIDKKAKTKKQNKQIPDVKNVNTKEQSNKKIITQKKKSKKMWGDKPIRRKEINDKSFQLIINGKEVELVRFDGFPIMKKDAERLSELKNSMMKKGIPKTEVNRTIKLERRRAEKALARMKREVCYNCRKGGHNLSDCPDLKSNIPGVGAAEGICFKCGSTEHRQFECKVQKEKEFRFANCFICKEQGHIARQCPDNAKGLYPNGGCCKLCGDVTHLRKDCPTVQSKKEETSIKLQTLDTGDNIEDIDLQSKPVHQEAPRKPKKIKF